MFLVVLTYTQYTQLQFVLVYVEFVNYYVSLLWWCDSEDRFSSDVFVIRRCSTDAVDWLLVESDSSRGRGWYSCVPVARRWGRSWYSCVTGLVQLRARGSSTHMQVSASTSRSTRSSLLRQSTTAAAAASQQGGRSSSLTVTSLWKCRRVWRLLHQLQTGVLSTRHTVVHCAYIWNTFEDRSTSDSQNTPLDIYSFAIKV